jgi:uncharacterized protein YkwD
MLLACAFVTVLAVAGIAVPGVNAPPAQAASCANADGLPGPLPGHITRDETEKALKCLIDNERESHGLVRLLTSSKLRDKAGDHSDSMDKYNYFSHNSRDGHSFIYRIKQTGYLSGTSSWQLGENIGWGRDAPPNGFTPRDMFNGWMNSASHRDTMLKPSFREIGVGVTWGSPTGSLEYGGAIYTADFGRRNY